MELFSLLEKNEQRQIRIFQLLLEQSELSINEALVQLSVDRATFKEDLSLLKLNLVKFTDQLVLDTENGKIFLRRLGNLSMTDVYYSYLKDAVKYQILMHLLAYGTLERQKLLDSLGLSPATFTRRIRELNTLLAEFHLQIKNGKLLGSESQIRYFYFQLLWFGRPYLVNLNEFNDPTSDILLGLMKKEFDFPFTEDGQIKFKLWLSITKKRLRVLKRITPDYTNLPSSFFESNTFLLSLQKILARFFIQHAFIWNQNETLIFYLFMICNFTLDIQNNHVDKLLHEKLRDDRVVHLNQAFKFILDETFYLYSFSERFAEEISLTLIQNHSRLIYFRGWVNIFGHQGLNKRVEKIQDKRLLNLCETLTTRSLDILNQSEFDNQNSRFELFVRYASILQRIFKEVEPCLNVACDFPYERVMADIVIDIIREQVSTTFKINLTKYDKNKQYDVILASQLKEYPRQENARVFVMLSNEYDFDFPYLNEVLRESYLQKNNLRMRL
ncbi:helix-turn-helix domain-containing protein [Enterococcus dongliensis]|uniref:Helix-turn-helix domain-containing protein n=1 Tax=Enterococcus dongliensis TaxID=2559925 RepID=A0AAW8TGJ8_9ENTE|nr:helix-turn-helix domain-containing protein [Enterococcus dongliensis]MDT2595670.1 helix-turn-helix domain-containing protein [Enterococcus dongliensis]MDT2633882.1 helix-turn-helix domain-containing protein [Enterococcus dongliensis]MDT2636282.1 helix-turn-helix domain-containing protein [Enterococcus dongliensis]MDT2641504.1 helix-turn-helix domain-containing protein [Enterococcus dongliensis]MDT2646830.1 helix-turn-helix domain-containing protein [Enterococcus dongliensis]